MTPTTAAGARTAGCPKCGSKHPHLHPAIQFEGEVEVCTGDFHLVPTNQNSEWHIAKVLAKRCEAL